MTKEPLAQQTNLRFSRLVRDFFQFLKKPTLRRARVSQNASAWYQDWSLQLSLGMTFKWAAFMWAVNLFLLAPIALLANQITGASSRIEFSWVLVPLAIIWAPLVEELLFRFSLRRPTVMLWLVPVMCFVVIRGPSVLNIALACLVLFVLWVLPNDKRFAFMHYCLPFSIRRLYVKYFSWAVYGFVTIFALMHLFNYDFSKAKSLWLLPLFVIPQWFSGIVLAWMRVRFGILNAIMLHAMFNGGPMVLAVMAQLALPKNMSMMLWLF